MTIETIVAIALLCAPLPQARVCQKTYIKCVNKKILETLDKNETPNESDLLAICVLREGR